MRNEFSDFTNTIYAWVIFILMMMSGCIGVYKIFELAFGSVLK